MAAIALNLGDLLLDLENPRISKASGQREVLQKIIEDQDLKLVESVVTDGLNPMDRWLVMKSTTDRALIPRGCYLTVSNAKIAEIVKELRDLPLAQYPHSISVLFRVFLETSVDAFLTSAGIPLSVTVTTKGGARAQDKSLDAKVRETIAELVKKGVSKKVAGVDKGLSDKNSPPYIDTLHLYVHNRFYSPTEREPKVAWDNAQLFFENIWK
jgi:hypothetical protein